MTQVGTIIFCYVSNLRREDDKETTSRVSTTKRKHWHETPVQRPNKRLRKSSELSPPGSNSPYLDTQRIQSSTTTKRQRGTPPLQNSEDEE